MRILRNNRSEDKNSYNLGKVGKVPPSVCLVGQLCHAKFSHGDIDDIGDIANIATFASVFFHKISSAAIIQNT